MAAINSRLGKLSQNTSAFPALSVASAMAPQQFIAFCGTSKRSSEACTPASISIHVQKLPDIAACATYKVWSDAVATTHRLLQACRRRMVKPRPRSRVPATWDREGSCPNRCQCIAAVVQVRRRSGSTFQSFHTLRCGVVLYCPWRAFQVNRTSEHGRPTFRCSARHLSRDVSRGGACCFASRRNAMMRTCSAPPKSCCRTALLLVAAGSHGRRYPA